MAGSYVLFKTDQGHLFFEVSCISRMRTQGNKVNYFLLRSMKCWAFDEISCQIICWNKFTEAENLVIDYSGCSKSKGWDVLPFSICVLLIKT